MNSRKTKNIAITGAVVGLLFTLLHLLTLQASIECSAPVPLLMISCSAMLQGLLLPIMGIVVMTAFAFYILRRLKLPHALSISGFSLLFVWQFNKLSFLAPWLWISLLLSTLAAAVIFLLSYLYFTKLRVAFWVKTVTVALLFLLFAFLSAVVYIYAIRVATIPL